LMIRPSCTLATRAALGGSLRSLTGCHDIRRNRWNRSQSPDARAL
jgi:hypothetical protein